MYETSSGYTKRCAIIVPLISVSLLDNYSARENSFACVCSDIRGIHDVRMKYMIAGKVLRVARKAYESDGRGGGKIRKIIVRKKKTGIMTGVEAWMA